MKYIIILIQKNFIYTNNSQLDKMKNKPPLPKKRKRTRWVLVAFMGIITILETVLAINLTAAEGCGAIGAGILLIFSIPITAVLLIILFIVWLLLGRRKATEEQATEEQATDEQVTDNQI